MHVHPGLAWVSPNLQASPPLPKGTGKESEEGTWGSAQGKHPGLVEGTTFHLLLKPHQGPTGPSPALTQETKAKQVCLWGGGASGDSVRRRSFCEAAAPGMWHWSCLAVAGDWCIPMATHRGVLNGIYSCRVGWACCQFYSCGLYTQREAGTEPSGLGFPHPSTRHLPGFGAASRLCCCRRSERGNHQSGDGNCSV